MGFLRRNWGRLFRRVKQGQGAGSRKRRGRQTTSRPNGELLEGRQLLAASNVAVNYRSGQTFVTWTEDAAASGEQYHVYRSASPITTETLAQAERLTNRWGPLGDDTSRHYLTGAGGSANFVISDLGAPLGDGQGLFVHTVQAGTGGNAYYAVTQVTAGVENRSIVAGVNATPSAVSEQVATPRPVLVAQQNGGLGRLYTQFMDYAAWNPTYQGYAYNYTVALPRGYNPATAYPLKLELHAYGGRYLYEPEAMYEWPAIHVFPDDPAVNYPRAGTMQNTWWYGFAADHDFRTGTAPTSGRIANFTESRVMRAVDEVQSMFRIDGGLVHAFGSSMGASGSVSLGLRYGNVFSAIYASQPMTNYFSSGPFHEEWPRIWGSKAANLPILNLGPHAQHLTQYGQGGSAPTGVWDWMNHPLQMQRQGGAGSALMMFGHGKNDNVIDWATQGKPFIEAVTRARIPFTAEMRGNWEHNWMGFGGAHHAMCSRGYGDLGDFIFRRESLPSISFASGSGPLVPPDTGNNLYNLNIVWSTVSNPFDLPIVDQASRYEITLASTSGATQTADVTPRRLQAFVATPGVLYRYENRDAATGSLIATGTVTADASGRIVVPSLQIRTGRGSRLAITPADAGPAPTRRGIDWLPVTTDGRVYPFSDQLPISQMNPTQLQFAATRYVGSQKQTTAEINQLRAIDPDFALLHYRLASASSNLDYIQSTGTWGRDWNLVNSQESWFEHSIVDGQRLHSNSDHWDLHDITNPDFQQYYINSTIATMRATGAQGTFADSFTAGIDGLLGQQTGDPRFDGTGALTGPWQGPNWLQRMSSFASTVAAAYDAAPEGFLYMPNLGQLTNSWATLDLSAIDGGMLELFAMDAPGYLADASEYSAAMDRALTLSRAGKALILQPGLLGGLGGNHRGFLIGSYYLLKGQRTYLNIVDGGAVGMYWYPEYDLNLGTPLSTTAASMRDYDLADGTLDQVYRRDFSDGRVYVNGADVSRTIDLGSGTYTRVRGTGGGTVDAADLAVDGSYVGGSLLRTSVTGLVTLTPGETLILNGAGGSPPPVDPPPVDPPPVDPPPVDPPADGDIVLSAVADTQLTNFQNQSANLGGSNYLQFYKAQNELYRDLLSFNLSSVPAGTQIASARVELFHVEGNYDNGPMGVQIRALARGWEEGTGTDHFTPSPGASWANAATGVPWTTPGGDFVTTNLGLGAGGIVGSATIPSFSSQGWRAFDVTPAVRGWLNGTLPNQGLAFLPTSGDYTEHLFASTEHTNAAWRPRLVLVLDSSPPPPSNTTDLRVLSATSTQQNTLTVTYEIANAAAPAFQLGVYTSADRLFGNDQQFAMLAISDAADLTVGSHTKTWSIGTAAGQIALPGAGRADLAGDYRLLVVADPADAIHEEDATGTQEDNVGVYAGAYGLANGPLMIQGSEANDQLTLSGSLTVSWNGVSSSYNTSSGSGVRARLHGGDDTLSGLGLARSIVAWGGAGNDSLSGGSAVDTFHGGEGNDQLTGGAGNDIYAYDASGSLGIDTLNEQGGGIDRLDFSATLVDVTVDLAQASLQTVHAQLGLVLGSDSTIEDVRGGAGNDTLAGNALANRLTGGAGNDTLRGRSGDDTYLFDVDGSLGVDTLLENLQDGIDTLDFAASTGRAVQVDLAQPAAQLVHANLTLVLGRGDAFENAIGGSQADTLLGNQLANVLSGGAGADSLAGRDGADTLVGGAGNDTLQGDAGNDTYSFVANSGLGSDTLVESPEGGNDLLDFAKTTASSGVIIDLANAAAQVVNSFLTLTLGNGSTFEMVVGSSRNDTLRGNAAANVLVGGAGNDTLLGFGGRDLLFGGSGQDTLRGGDEEDLVVAAHFAAYVESTKTYQRAALDTLRSEWMAPERDYATRVANLRNSSSLNATTDGSAVDTLFGEAGLDWFWAFANDSASDRNTGGSETLN